ncbi:unnamed protein product [Caenorhabditis angaria]|uniref:Serpentine Receptor, class H n=1 Tax=Caenorhabditis angaria TaxID=860376 RepID=A0A9P1N6D6_9PELO|nr:unnamed protein product [Caenorhabditis angaria]
MNTDSEDFLVDSLHFLALTGLPIHFLGFYFILCNTPVTMKSVKLPMLYLHFWNVVWDVYLSILYVPFVVFPFPAGYTLGLISSDFLNFTQQSCIAVTLLVMIGSANVFFFANRYNRICMLGKPMKKRKKFILIGLNLLFAICSPIPINFLPVDQSYAKKFILKTIPSFSREILKRDDFRVICLHKEYLVISLLIIIAVIGIQLIRLIVKISLELHYSLQASINSASTRTFNIQKAFFYTICFQTSIPVIGISFPVFYMIYSYFTYYFDQSYNNFAIIALSLYGQISTMTMIFVHKPYRKKFLGAFDPREFFTRKTKSIPEVRTNISTASNIKTFT